MLLHQRQQMKKLTQELITFDLKKAFIKYLCRYNIRIPAVKVLYWRDAVFRIPKQK